MKPYTDIPNLWLGAKHPSYSPHDPQCTQFPRYTPNHVKGYLC